MASASSSRLPSGKQFMESSPLSDSKSTEASTSISVDELGAVDSASVPSTSRIAEVIHGCWTVNSSVSYCKFSNGCKFYSLFSIS